MKHTKKVLIVVLVVGLALMSSGCKKKTQPVDTPTPPETAPMEAPATTPPPQPEPTPTEVTDFGVADVETADLPNDDDYARWRQQGVLRTVYFGFDSYDLDDMGRAVLQANAEWLRNEGARANIMVAGHCDERGTIEYNLALGDRRAMAARSEMSARGVDSSRISTISYGEERAADPGHNESAWAQNRRAAFRFAN